jgi:hypothetical protein
MSYPQNSGSPFQPQPNPPGSVPTPYGAYGGPGYPGEPPRPSSGNGCLWAMLFGGLGFVVVVALVCGIGGYYAVKNAKSFAISIARDVAVNVVKESELSEEDKQEIIVQVDRVVAAYKDGEIDEKDLEKILKEIQSSPLIPLAVVYGMEKQYLDKSGLTDEEKADAKKQLQRLIRGAMEKKIADSDVEKLMAPLQQTGPNGEQQMKQTLTDEEIKTFVAGAKKLADDAMVPDEEFQVDIGEEVKRIVDAGLGTERE